MIQCQSIMFSTNTQKKILFKFTYFKGFDRLIYSVHWLKTLAKSCTWNRKGTIPKIMFSPYSYKHLNNPSNLHTVKALTVWYTLSTSRWYHVFYMTSNKTNCISKIWLVKWNSLSPLDDLSRNLNHRPSVCQYKIRPTGLVSVEETIFFTHICNSPWHNSESCLWKL